METIETMQRYELKYIVNKEQIQLLKKEFEGHLKLDQYGKTSIASIYYDTPNFQLIRTSIEKPEFKEKIRLRSYGLANDSSKVFLELKRKSEGLVYKRRIETNINDVNQLLNKDMPIIEDNQIAKEINYFKKYYKKLVPAYLIIYDRSAYFEPNGDLRLTIDENPRYRTSNLNLVTSMDGEALLPEGCAILEIKVQNSIPLWLTSILSKGHIYKTSYSKVGEAFKQSFLKYS